MERLKELRDQITSRVLGHWWDHQLGETSAVIAPLTECLPALARVNGCLDRDTFLRVARTRRGRPKTPEKCDKSVSPGH